MLRLLSLNTWQERGPWRERWELIFAGLKFYLPDIVAFQEVFNMDWADEIQKRSGFPYLSKSGQNSGLVFLSKYPVLKSECLTYKTKSPNEDYNRYAHFALFQAGRKKIAGFNTHLSWLLPEDSIRLGQTEELLCWRSQKARRWLGLAGSYPSFLMGDLNSAPNKPSVEIVKKVMKDSYAEMNPGSEAVTWDYRNPYAERARDHMPERRLDYIFTKGVKLLKSELVFNQSDANGTYPSDHFGVMTEIDL
ncbi:MAG TPA: hypothetical protein DIS66_06995 [Candidatus Omnitrophica bacterium]|nr:hypothetical protein [Candidatus Omnitrophota bacterium]